MVRGISLSFLLLMWATASHAQVRDGNNVLFQHFTSNGSGFTLDSTSRIVLSSANDELVDILNTPRGLLQRLREATGLEIQITTGVVASSKDIVLSNSPDAAFKAFTVTASLVIEGSTTSITASGTNKGVPRHHPGNVWTSFRSNTDEVSRNIGHHVFDEGYKYQVSATGVTLQFHSDIGAIRGIQSVINLLMQDGNAVGAHRGLPGGVGVDYPVYEFRSLMMDTGRYFHPKQNILALLEKMSLHKMNVLHMHLNDDGHVCIDPATGWTRQKEGAFRLDLINDRRRKSDGTTTMHCRDDYYTKKDWFEILRTARAYGIEVMPEFDAPGHAEAWKRDPVATAEGLEFLSNTTSRSIITIIDIRTPDKLAKAVKYIKDLVVEYRAAGWIPSKWLHMGVDESSQYSANTREHDKDYVVAMLNAIEHDETTNPHGYEKENIMFWLDTGHSNLDSIDDKVIRLYWRDQQNDISREDLAKVVGKRWIDAHVRLFYITPGDPHGDVGLSPRDVYSNLYNHRLGRYSQYQTIPMGLSSPLWGDNIQRQGYGFAAANRREHVNALLVPTVAGMGFVTWYGHIKRNGRVINYDQTNYDNLIPVSQEMSSHWVRERFPYLSAAQAKKILDENASHRCLKTTGGNNGALATVTYCNNTYAKRGNYSTKDWMLWDNQDMEKAFGGPSALSAEMVIEMPGEGGAFSSGRLCSDLAYSMTIRATSVCEEDTWTNNLSGNAGSLRKKGKGTLKLRGNNKFGGNIVIEGGAVDIAAKSGIGRGMVVLDGGTLSFSADLVSAGAVNKNVQIPSGKTGGMDTSDNDVEVSQVVSGAGILKKSGVGKLSLKNTANTFSGGLVIAEGEVAVAALGSLGAAAGGLTFAGGTLGFEADGIDLEAARAIELDGDGSFRTSASGHEIEIGGVISGAGDLKKLGDGSLVLMGANDYTGATRVDGGALKVDISKLPDMSDIHAGSGTTLVLSAAADGKHDGDISGVGTALMFKDGSGELTLNGDNAAQWLISDGSVVSKAGFSGDVRVNGSQQKFVFGQTGADIVYSGVLSGRGKIVKSGGKRLTLAGDSSGFSGSFDVEADSTLYVQNMLGGDVAVKAMGELAGIGTIGGNVNIAAGGKLVASSAMVIEGNLILNGDYEAEFGSGARIAGTADISSGTGIVLNRLSSPFSNTDNAKFNILVSAGSLTGEFVSVDTTALPFVKTTVDYYNSGTGGTVQMRAGVDDAELMNLLDAALVVTEVEQPEPEPEPEPGPEEQEQPEAPPLQLEQVEEMIENASANPLLNNNAAVVGLAITLDVLRISELQMKAENEITDEERDELEGFPPILLSISALLMNMESTEEAKEKILDELPGEVHASAKTALISGSSDLGSAVVAPGRESRGGGLAGDRRNVVGSSFSLKSGQWNLDEDKTDPASLWFKIISS